MNAIDAIPDALFPFERHYREIAGHRMHYVDEGRGEPIVCVHGNPTWSFYYREVVNTFRESHRVVAVDHVGCGLSDKPGDSDYPYRLTRRVDDLEQLLDALELTANVTLVVHDWGGMIGSAVACRKPERIARMVILNTGAFLNPKGKRIPKRLATIRNTPFGSLLVQGGNAFARAATRMAVVNPLPRDVRRAYVAPYDSWANRIATLRFVQDIPLGPEHPSYATAKWTDDNLHRLAAIPKLICWGARDFVFDDAFLDEWKRRCPDAEVHRFADAGHYVLEDAGQQILPLIRAFIAKHPIPANGAQPTTSEANA